MWPKNYTAWRGGDETKYLINVLLTLTVLNKFNHLKPIKTRQKKNIEIKYRKTIEKIEIYKN